MTERSCEQQYSTLVRHSLQIQSMIPDRTYSMSYFRETIRRAIPASPLTSTHRGTIA